MQAVADGANIVAKPKKRGGGDEKPKRHGTLIRVSDEFAEAVRQAAAFEGLSHAEFANKYLLPVAEKRYRDAVLREAKRMSGEP